MVTRSEAVAYKERRNVPSMTYELRARMIEGELDGMSRGVSEQIESVGWEEQ